MIDKISLVLKGDRLQLRPLQLEDITDEYVTGLNDPEVNRYLVGVRQCKQTYETVGDFVVSNLENPHSILFGIFIYEDLNPLVGTIRISEMDFFHYTASIGICLFAKRAWKKGYAREALKVIRNYLFETQGLHYLEAGVYAKNQQSIKLFTHAGFQEWFRIKDKFRFIDSFEEAIFFVAINPLFNQINLQKMIH